jgi:alpha-beta hydrolase superfamily lysophospholipase
VRARTSQPVRLKTRDKLELAGIWYAPTTKGERSPGVLLAHAAGSDSSQLEDLALYLQKKGFGVLALDARGHGDSVTDKVDWSKADEATRKTLWAYSAKDLEAGAEYLRKQPNVHAANLTVVGIGTGCALAVRHALQDQNARAVVLIDPSKEPLGYDLAAGLGALGGLPTLLVASKNDRKTVEELQKSAHDTNHGEEYVELSVLKAKASELLEDKRFNTTTASWLRDVLEPKDK